MPEELLSKYVAALGFDSIKRDSFEQQYTALIELGEGALRDEIARCYAETSAARDGFSRLGLLYMKCGDLPAALRLFEEDGRAGRQSWWCALRHAEALFRTGGEDAALEKVLEVYGVHPEAVNGFSEIAYQIQGGDAEQAERLFEKDDRLGRMSAGFRLNYAAFLAGKGCLEKSMDQVRNAYRSGSGQDGFLRIAQAYHLPRKDSAEVLELCRQDFEQKRMSAQGELFLAEAYAMTGDIDSARERVAQAYTRSSGLKDGYSRVARAYCLPRHKIPLWIELCEQDRALKRQTDRGRMLQAEACFSIGNSKVAFELLDTLDSPPDCGWARLAESWVDSFQWCRGTGFEADPVLARFKERMGKRQAPQEELARFHRAEARLMVARSRVREAGRRLGFDVGAQLREIAAKRNAGHRAEEPLPFLDARLRCSSAADLFVLYHELVICGSDHFEAQHERPFIIDGGANIGAAIAYFKWLYPQAEIVAFEPNPELFDICSANIRSNGWKAVTLHPYALAGESGSMTFYCDEEMPMGSSLTSRPAQEGRRFRAITVEARTLRSFMTKPVDFLKLDIEGAEAEVLAELGSLLQTVRGGILEYHHADGGENTLSSIVGAFQENGHRYAIRAPGTIWGGQDCEVGRIASRWSRSLHFEARRTSRVAATTGEDA